jgi:hypothetical protein
MNPMYPIERPEFTAYMINVADNTRISRVNRMESGRRLGLVGRIYSSVMKRLSRLEDSTQITSNPVPTG